MPFFTHFGRDYLWASFERPIRTLASASMEVLVCERRWLLYRSPRCSRFPRDRVSNVALGSNLAHVWLVSSLVFVEGAPNLELSAWRSLSLATPSYLSTSYISCSSRWPSLYIAWLVALLQLLVFLVLHDAWALRQRPLGACLVLISHRRRSSWRCHSCRSHLNTFLNANSFNRYHASFWPIFWRMLSLLLMTLFTTRRFRVALARLSRRLDFGPFISFLAIATSI